MNNKVSIFRKRPLLGDLGKSTRQVHLVNSVLVLEIPSCRNRLSEPGGMLRQSWPWLRWPGPGL